ncbi:MAG: hypothetical protein QOG03_1566 [Actinomycetota bacterium]|nr:hypothetical protein [Actinomycetota bacterium]
MSFRPDALRGASAQGLPGQIDFRLARNAVLAEFRRGRLSRLDVCDAHPELLRAATHVGMATDDDCPICESPALVHVSYVFGPRLPAHGRCVTSKAELAKLARRPTELACYVVEVCPDCSWNHLARSLVIGGQRSSRS